MSQDSIRSPPCCSAVDSHETSLYVTSPHKKGPCACEDPRKKKKRTRKTQLKRPERAVSLCVLSCTIDTIEANSITKTIRTSGILEQELHWRRLNGMDAWEFLKGSLSISSCMCVRYLPRSNKVIVVSIAKTLTVLHPLLTPNPITHGGYLEFKFGMCYNSIKLFLQEGQSR